MLSTFTNTLEEAENLNNDNTLGITASEVPWEQLQLLLKYVPVT